MARLTRTQKYAELRDEMSHDREESLNTQQLDKIEDHFSSLRGDKEPVLNRQEPTRVVEEIKETENESMKSLDDILNSMMSENYDNNVKPVQPVQQETRQPRMAEFEEQPNIKPQEINVNNNFIHETFDEVNTYNKVTGKTTLDDLSNQLVDEVRHPENAKENIEDEFSRTISLELNKVLDEIGSLEEPIQKDNVIVQEPQVVQPQPVEVAPVEQQTVIQNEVKPIENISPIQETFEHPTLAQTIEQAAVEIKNISETVQLEPVLSNEDVVDDTIPFTVERQPDEDDDDYEDEEPSKALNVILGILIFVLVAVLGVIIYYILIAKGIIK